jgi:NAD(P)-dependent dehydrogenase (short-subunit alcohol dehydrogenase family)
MAIEGNGDAGVRGAVVITGASSGIGRECSLYLDSRGYRVFAGVRKTADGDALAQSASPRLTPLIIDVTDARTISDASALVEKSLGDDAFIGLVNNAGIGVGGPVEFLTPSELRRQMDVNLLGPLAVTQAFMPMIRRSRGRIVNVSSIGGRVATPLLGPYCASKFALEALSDCMRAELKPFGISVSIVEPGSIKTRIFDKAAVSVDEIVRALPADGLRYYSSNFETMRKLIAMQDRNAVPAERVAKVVEHALTAARPRTRYLVGFDAHLMATLHWLLPDRAFDALLSMFTRRVGATPAVAAKQTV